MKKRIRIFGSLLVIITLIISACWWYLLGEPTSQSLSEVDRMEKQASYQFVCQHEADNSPPLTEEAEQYFREAREIEIVYGYKDEATINRLYHQAADLGHWKASYNLAMRYRDGAGWDQEFRDPYRAFDILETMVEANIPLGIYGMAVLLMEGKGVDRDMKMASIYMHRAAELGNAKAQHYLGRQAYGRYDYTLAKQYYRCAMEQGHADSAKELADMAKISEQNYPKAIQYYLRAGSLGHTGAMLQLAGAFEDDDFYNKIFGYDIDDKLSNCFYEERRRLKKYPLDKLPNLAQECPIPLHPIMGDGSEYPDVELRVEGFLERLKTSGHDPEWEEEAGKRYMEMLRGFRSSKIEEENRPPIVRKKVTDLEPWITPHVQVGEFFVKYQSIYLHLINGGLEKKIESPYLIATMDTFHLDYIPVEQFHEQTEGQFRLWLSQKG